VHRDGEISSSGNPRRESLRCQEALAASTTVVKYSKAPLTFPGNDRICKHVLSCNTEQGGSNKLGLLKYIW
jgi:hypothetical protein